MSIFPFHVYDDFGGHEMWRKMRETTEETKRMIWYEADMEVLDRKTVIFSIYGMKDSVYGGRGKLLGEFKMEVDKKDLTEFIKRRVGYLAMKEFERREAERRRREIGVIYNEILTKEKLSQLRRKPHG